MTMVSPHLGSHARRRDNGRMPARARVSARIADRDVANLELLLLLAVLAALVGAVLPTLFT